jgi:hypothetical protein
MPVVRLLRMEDEEKPNRLAVKFLLKKYHKILRWMYKKYT